MVSKDTTERRVYVLPTELLERLRAYQNACGITSEVEAARRLLDAALQMRENIEDILNKLANKYKEEQDLRVLAREILVTHPLIREIKINDNALDFMMKSGWQGQITANGKLFFGENGDQYMQQYTPPKPRDATPSNPQPPKPSSSKAAPSWDAPEGGSVLDDEIPF